MKKEKLITAITAIVILIAVGIFVAILFTNGAKPATFTLVDDKLEVGGSYGKTIYLQEADISLIDSVTVVSRDNGSNAGNALKGSFTITMDSKNISAYLNLTNKKDACFIRIIDKNGSYYLISAENPTATKNLFDTLV